MLRCCLNSVLLFRKLCWVLLEFIPIFLSWPILLDSYRNFDDSPRDLSWATNSMGNQFVKDLQGKETSHPGFLGSCFHQLIMSLFSMTCSSH